jgi:HSP20 family protein
MKQNKTTKKEHNNKQNKNNGGISMFNLVPFKRNNNVSDDFMDMRKFMDSFWDDTGLMGVFRDNGGGFKADIKETEKEYILEAELPGVNKENINLKIEEETLKISVNTSEEKKDERSNYIRRERRVGTYCRSFHLQGIKEEEVSANYENGILKVILPKDDVKREKGRNIDIN